MDNGLSGICGGALVAAAILAVIGLLFGRRAMHACSARMAFIGAIAVIALVVVIAALGGLQVR